MLQSLELRVRGVVQGVGFRPAIWRLATELRLQGDVLNDGAGVLIRLAGPDAAIAAFQRRLRDEPPPLARIDAIEATWPVAAARFDGFSIAGSRPGAMATAVAPDAATCADCLAEIADTSARRFRYPFTNCTQCGPRLTILETAPYDRANTTMRDFRMCPACRAEYEDPADRRFHAQPIACPACGPRATLSAMDACPAALPPGVDAVAMAACLVAAGQVVALKGVGGFHLACDATGAAAVAALRRRKRRPSKPFAVMMPDLATARRYCAIGPAEAALLQSAAAPVVLLDATGAETLPDAVAPGLRSLGVMLPSTPLHHLLMIELGRPAVMTSGNLSGEPQCVDGAEARVRLAVIADAMLDHDRPIVSAIDDSVVRIMGGRPAILRRARGYAPAPILLPPGFEAAPPVLAMGGETKAAFCLVAEGGAVLSQHLGDLEDALAFDAYRGVLDRHRRLLGHRPHLCAVDGHPDYLSRTLGEGIAEAEGLALVEVQHHHAHVAACLVENGVPLHAAPVLGIALDGLGMGDDGALWGGEVLLAGYCRCRRVASLEAVAMPGGASAVREPWRNTLAHILAAVGWAEFAAACGGTDLHRGLAAKPVAAVASLIRAGVNAPLASSTGRLFDAVAGAIGIAFDRQGFEGEAASRLEALAAPVTGAAPYPFHAAPDGNGLMRLSPAPMWRALLADLAARSPPAMITARFHLGFAAALAGMALTLLREHGAGRTVALSGGSFQNRLLLETLKRRLEADGVTVLVHAKVPANDGGLALGQAAVAAARHLAAGDT